MTSSVPSSPSQPLSNLAAALIKFHEAVPTIHDNAESYHGGLQPSWRALKHRPSLEGQRSCGVTTTRRHQRPAWPQNHLDAHQREHLSAVTPLSINSGKNGTQEWGKAVTYSRRYGLLSVLGLCVGIVDNDADSDAVAKPAAKLQIQQAPKKSAPVEGVAEADQPLTTEERNMLLGLISEMDAGKKENFCKSFRFAFKLGDNAKVSSAITSRKHQAWIQENA